MFQVVSFPHADDISVMAHLEGLQMSGARHWVGPDIDLYFRETDPSSVIPELIIVDFSHLGRLRRAVQRFPGLSNVPTIVITNLTLQPSDKEDFLVLGQLSATDQLKPESFVKIVLAFTLAQKNGPVTPETFQRALDIVARTNPRGGGPTRPRGGGQTHAAPTQ